MKNDRWLWTILLAGAAVRTFGLGERSLSYDECQQYWASQGNVLISNREITLDPPGFAYLLHVHSLAGRSETWLRLLPWLFGILAIAAVYHLAMAATSSPWIARAAAFFMAFAPYAIRYSQSLRVYSQAMLCAAVLVALFLESTDEEGSRGWRNAALLGVSTFAALLSVYGSVWIVSTMGILMVWRGRRVRGPAWWRSVLGLMVGAALASPWYLLSVPVQLTQGTPPSFYEDKFMPAAFLPGLRFLARGTWDLSSFFSFIHPAAGLLFGPLAVLGMVRLCRQRRGAALVFLFLGVLVSAAAASAFQLYPYGGTRQMLFAAPLFYVAGAAGIESLRHRFRGLPATALLVAIAVGCGIFLHRYHTEPGGQDLRPVIKALEEAAYPEDRILVNKDALPQFRFYYHGESARVVEGRESVIRDYLPEVNRLMATAPRSRWWLVFSHGWRSERRGELAAVDPAFLAGQRIEAHRAAAYLFVPRAAEPAPARDGDSQ
jgi:4-amino-4-deoxy-L-arabinose transferase-like glycosyltransferase